MNYSIRAVMKDDYVNVLPLFDEGDVIHREAVPEVFHKPAGPPRTEQYFKDMLHDKNSAIFAAVSEEVFAGLIAVSIRKSQDIPILVPRTYAYIDDIIVKKENRRQGIGEALMKHAQQWAIDKGITQLELNVWDFNNNAIDFFQKMGYSMSRHQMRKSIDKKRG